MKVLVDTCVWSSALRREESNLELASKLKDLIRDGRVVMIGPIRQEILSGISDVGQFNRLRDAIASFEEITLKAEHFVKAAEFSNFCRRKGIQGSSTDFLICAVAYLEDLMIFTTDTDFERYQKHLRLKFFK